MTICDVKASSARPYLPAAIPVPHSGRRSRVAPRAPPANHRPAADTTAAQLLSAAALDRRGEAGAHTRPLFSSTSAVLVSVPFCVKFVTTYDPYIY